MMDAAPAAGGGGLLGRYWGVAGRRCGCAAPAAVHCRTDGSYLCAACDAAHARVWVCEVCERAPAAVACRADANPLARRHERAPVHPIGSAAAQAMLLFGGGGGAAEEEDVLFGAAPGKDKQDDFLFADVMADPFLGAEVVSRFAPAADSVVPNNNNNNSNGSNGGVFELDFGGAKARPSSYTAASLAHSGSSSEVGLVPDAICGRGVIELDFAQSKAAYLPYATTPAGAAAVPDRGSLPTPTAAESREARLMRYRQKRKNRRFQKTIRYASRKAYAETRPRVKGRFAKRADDNDISDAVNAHSVAPPPPLPQQPSSYPSPAATVSSRPSDDATAFESCRVACHVFQPAAGLLPPE